MNVKRGELKRAKHLPGRGVVKEFERAELVGPWLRLGSFLVSGDEVEWCELEENENDGPVSSGPPAGSTGGAGTKAPRRRGGSDIG